MNEQVIMNDEVVENVAENATKEIATSKSAKIAKTAVGVGLATLVGVVIYKKVIKPIAAKIKAKKAAKNNAVADVVEIEDEPIKPIFDENGKVIEE